MNRTQESIILSIMDWAKTNRDPIPRKIIIKRMGDIDIPESTVKASIATLIRKGYIRKAVSVRREVSYVLLATIPEPVASYDDYGEER